MFGHDTGLFDVVVDNGAALAASTEVVAWVNNRGYPVRLVAASYCQLTAITSDTDDYYNLAVHICSAAGAHTTAAATATLQTTALTAFVPLDLTLTSTAADLVVGTTETVNCLATKVSAGPNLDASGKWVLTFAPGTGAATS